MFVSPLSRPILCLLIVTVAFAGCTTNTSTKPAPVTEPTEPTKTSPSPTATTREVPRPPVPGTAFGPKVYKFGSAALPNDTFNVSATWTGITFRYWLNSTAACYAIQSEAPAPPATATGAAPSLSFGAPSGARVVFPIPTQNVCGTSTNGGPIVGHQAISKTAPNEVGNWTVMIRGIGQNVQLRVVVDGS